jgi:type II secretory pathway predicted ATPase ExeA
MYEKHFRLRRRPFRSLPDTESYYPATTHEESLAELLAAINADEGLALLTGSPGTGKTVLGHCLLERLGKQVSSTFLIHSHFGDRAGLLRAILHDLALPYTGKTEQELRLELVAFLLKNYETGRRTILVLDEAQRLTPDLLEELRLLTNYEGDRGKTFQSVFVAQSTFLQLLKLPDLEVFDQRLSVRVKLDPLGVQEAADYLVHALRAEGARPKEIISDEALELLARQTSGVPRLLNRAADKAFQLACLAEADQVDAEAVLEALSELGIGADADAATGSFEGPDQLPVADRGAASILDLRKLQGEEKNPIAAQEEDMLAEDANPAAKPLLIATPRRPA